MHVEFVLLEALSVDSLFITNKDQYQDSEIEKI